HRDSAEPQGAGGRCSLTAQVGLLVVDDQLALGCADRVVEPYESVAVAPVQCEMGAWEAEPGVEPLQDADRGAVLADVRGVQAHAESKARVLAADHRIGVPCDAECESVGPDQVVVITAALLVPVGVWIENGSGAAAFSPPGRCRGAVDANVSVPVAQCADPLCLSDRQVND